MGDHRQDIRSAYDELVTIIDAHYDALEQRLASERASMRRDPDLIASLELDLESTTQLIDLLESAVSVSVERLFALDRRS